MISFSKFAGQKLLVSEPSPWIGLAVIMEDKRKMTGCLQTFGGHCKYTVLYVVLVTTEHYTTSVSKV